MRSIRKGTQDLVFLKEGSAGYLPYLRKRHT